MSKKLKVEINTDKKIHHLLKKMKMVKDVIGFLDRLVLLMPFEETTCGFSVNTHITSN
jgi:hypothetical protein